jgi:MFS family permease
MAMQIQTQNQTKNSNARWLTRNLLTLSAVSFFQDTASEMLYPVLPIFITTTLGAPALAVGIVDGAVEGLAALSKWRAGVSADRRKNRRQFIAYGYTMAVFGKLIVAAAWAWPVVLVGRGVDRFGKGMRDAPRDALLVAGIAQEHRGRAFGLHRAFDTAGAVVGPLLGLWLYRSMNGRIRPVLWAAIIPAIISVAFVALVREERERHSLDLPAFRTDGTRVEANVGAVRIDAPIRNIISILTMFSIVNVPVSLLILRAKTLGLSVSQIFLAYVLINIVYAVLSYPAGAISDRVHPALLLGVGMFAFALCCIGLAITSSRNAVWPLFATYGVFAAAADGVAKSWISRLARDDEQSRVQGVFAGCWSGGALAAGIWVGAAWGKTGRIPLMIAGVVGALVGAILLVGRNAFASSTEATLATYS